jgi:sigma-B regulation protein RsbU (phosphoserine phosphatase)
MFGKEPIYDVIRKNASSSADEILNAFFESLNSFLEGAKTEDDVTLVVVKISK